jgi:DNA-binding CsgD family transcriptional regulator
MLGGDHGQARPHFERCAALAELADDAQVLMWGGASAGFAGDLVRARRAFAHGATRARERGAIGLVAYGLQWVAFFELALGRPALARTEATDGLALAEECGDEAAAAHCRALLAWHAAIGGDDDGCHALADAARTWSSTHSVRFAAESADRALAVLDLGHGRHAAALDRLAARVSDLGAHPVRRLLVVGDLVEAAAGCDRPEAADAPLADLTAWQRATRSAWGEAILAGAEMQLAGDGAAIDALYDRAVQAHAAIELPFERARLELRYGALLRRARRRIDARQHLRAALDGFAQLGATPWEERAAEELRATGETARKRDASTIDDLTPQELQIARLAAEGATNRDIAGRLFLSPRTVEYHLRKVFTKLGVNTRTQLAGVDW